MEIWTRQREQIGWTPWPELIPGLSSLIDEPDAQILLHTEAPDMERELLIETLRLIHRLAPKTMSVIVASPYPSADLRKSLVPHKVDQFWVMEPHGAFGTATIGNVMEVADSLCPALHTLIEKQTTLSVCGCHHDRMVLAKHHLERWCLKGKERCPHWLERGPNGRQHQPELDA